MERGLLVARLQLDFFPSPSLSLCVKVSHSVSHVCHSALHSIYSVPHSSHLVPFHICIHFISAYLHLSPLISVYLSLSVSLPSPTNVSPFISFQFLHLQRASSTRHPTWSKFISSFYSHVSINAFTQYVNKEDSLAFVLLTMITECWMETLLWEVSRGIFLGIFSQTVASFSGHNVTEA